MRWYHALRRKLTGDINEGLSTDEAEWWAEECRRTRLKRRLVTMGQSAAMAFGPRLASIINAPDTRTRLVGIGVGSIFFVVAYWGFGTLNERIQLRMVRREQLPRYRLRRALVAELKGESGLPAEPTPAGSLERHDVP